MTYFSPKCAIRSQDIGNSRIIIPSASDSQTWTGVHKELSHPLNKQDAGPWHQKKLQSAFVHNKFESGMLTWPIYHYYDFKFS